MCNVWDKLTHRIAAHYISKVLSKSKLVDLDWEFGITASSDEVDHIGKTYLQLKLTIQTDTIDRNNLINSNPSNGVSNMANKRFVFIELSLEQFYHMLASLEKCKAFLDYVSPKPPTSLDVR